MNDQITIEYTVNRCYECGTYWAIESKRGWNARCPMCAEKDVQKAREESKTAVKAANALRGVIKRIQKLRK